jgi:uncharacterized protein (TIGR03000 family)
MTRKRFAFRGALLVAAALVFLTPGAGQARPRGGFGGFHGGFHGAFHYGGLHYGGFHYGAFHPYYHYGFHPYHHYYGYHPYYHHGYWPYFYNYTPYLYGYYPYYYNYAPYSLSSYPYDSSDLGSGSAYEPSVADSLASTSVGGGIDLMSYSSSSTPARTPTTESADTAAHVTVELPADARLWFNDFRTAATGPVREFHTPPLTAGTPYYYDVRASWNENGREVTQTQHLKVTPGARLHIDFPLAPKTSARASAAERG